MDAAYAEMRQAGATTVALEMVANNDVARISTSERASRPHSSRCTGSSPLIRGPGSPVHIPERTAPSERAVLVSTTNGLHVSKMSIHKHYVVGLRPQARTNR